MVTSGYQDDQTLVVVPTSFVFCSLDLSLNCHSRFFTPSASSRTIWKNVEVNWPSDIYTYPLTCSRSEKCIDFSPPDVRVHFSFSRTTFHFGPHRDFWRLENYTRDWSWVYEPFFQLPKEPIFTNSCRILYIDGLVIRYLCTPITSSSLRIFNFVLIFLIYIRIHHCVTFTLYKGSKSGPFNDLFICRYWCWGSSLHKLRPHKYYVKTNFTSESCFNTLSLSLPFYVGISHFSFLISHKHSNGPTT